jgi:hypothetical protein
MEKLRTQKYVATRQFLLRKDSEHGICVALWHPNPPYHPIRKGPAPVTPVEKGDDDAETNRCH